MSTPITEFFNQGLVTARHPALLSPGELQRATDCVYREKDPSIQRAPGRSIYNSTSLKTTPTGSTPAGLKGLAYLSFDSNTDQILAWPEGDGTNSYLYKSDFTTITGTFSLLTGPGSVASCVTNGTITVTAPAGSFTNMITGARVTGSGISSGTYVDVVNSGTQITLTKAATGSATVTLYFDVGVPFSLSDVGDEVMDVINWQETYFVLPRRGSVNRLIWKTYSGSVPSQTLIIRPAGLTPVTEAAAFSVQSGAGWSSVLGNGYYWFFVTELLSLDGGTTIDTEAGYVANSGRPTALNITAFATQFVRIVFPTIKNDGSNGLNRATHWSIYMSVIGPGAAAYPDNSNVPSMATFRRIAIVPIDETQKDIKFNNTTLGPNLPTTSAAISGVNQFTNPSGVFTRGGVDADTTTASRTGNAYAGFSFSTGSPYSGYTVTGIKVTVVSKTKSFGLVPYSVWLDNNGIKVSNTVGGIAFGNTFRPQSFGSQFDNWGITWTPSDIGNLRVMITKDKVNTTTELRVDYLEVTIFYSGASLDTGSVNLDGNPYQVVTYRSQIGTTVNDPAHYIIPTASTGDIFEGSLVLNDIAVPSVIRYSLANDPEAFPKPYFIQFNSKKKDIVTLIRTLGQVMVVGMRDSIKRVNYLPTEVDVDFQRGVAHEDIVSDHGIVGPHAATTFDLPGIGVVLAYVGYNGFYFTDAITSKPLNLDIRIDTLVNPAALATSILRVYPREKWLIFFYCPYGASHTKNTRALIFSYSPDKIKEGGFLPATGPLSISARSASPASLSGVPYFVSGHQSNGTVYVEDSGNTQASGYQVHDSSNSLANAPIIPSILTRRIYPSGYTRDSREQRIYVLHESQGATITASSNTTIDSPNVTSSAAFANVKKGMKVTGTGIPVNTLVITKTDNSNIVLSKNATATGIGVTLTFDDGILAVTVSGNHIGSVTKQFDTSYVSMTVGDLFVTHNDNIDLGFQLDFTKIVLPDLSTADLDRLMKLYNFTYLLDDVGTEQNRA